MAEQNGTQTEPQTTEPQTEPNQGEGAQGGSQGDPKTEPDGQGEGDGEVQDKHGQPGINREKYQRDMKAKDDKIAELQAQLDEKSKTEEGRAELKAEMDKLKADMADERVSHKLEMAGCRNVKAAKALLDDYDGDVAKLREDCPYLFSDGKQTGSTGLKPEGDAGKALDEKLDRAFGFKKKE